jgi:hypothetical protein
MIGRIGLLRGMVDFSLILGEKVRKGEIMCGYWVKKIIFAS